MESGGNKTAVINTSFIMIQTGKLILSVMSKNREKHSRVELRLNYLEKLELYACMHANYVYKTGAMTMTKG